MSQHVVAHVRRSVDGYLVTYDRESEPELVDDLVLAEDVVPGKLLSIDLELVEVTA